VIRFGRLVNGQFDPLTELGGSLLQRFAIDPAFQEVIPAQANVIAERQTTPLFGLGSSRRFLTGQSFAIPGPETRWRQGPGLDGAGCCQRTAASWPFGWKAQQATLLSFSGDAYLNEVGITSRLFPHENAPNGDTNLLALADTVADPEDDINPDTGKADIDTFTDFMRFLARRRRCH